MAIERPKYKREDVERILIEGNIKRVQELIDVIVQHSIHNPVMLKKLSDNEKERRIGKIQQINKKELAEKLITIYAKDVGPLPPKDDEIVEK